ncbi:flagellar filament capping protein FliD [uncultured Massilia sp.]|uniref:flagellar filament capping protein FliD n=1 Tax=uncultured Massilia sp. TaxID=169973 RepID=UPI0025E8931F|nr:flagellar filament capping protein FliD [uncultured Massilia sp.]
MASAITAPTYDPTTTASALADKTVSGMDSKIKAQQTATAATAKALQTLSSAISAFQSSLASLTGVGKTLLASSATLSDGTIATASAKAQAAAGSYSVFVKQVASVGQVSYDGVAADTAVPGGKLTVRLADESGNPDAPAPVTFDVDLATAADTDKDGKLSVRELAAAINQSPDNKGQVSAGIVTIGGQARLVLTSKNTGAANTISLDTAGLSDATLADSLATRTMVSEAKDAIVMFGGEGGTAIQQSSNTFTNIDGVSLTVTRAQSSGATPLTITVGEDGGTTAKNVQAFIDAYNKLKSTVDGLVSSGDPAAGTAAGAFAHDSGVLALQSRLVSVLRPVGSASLASYGVTAGRDGTLSLDSDRLSRQLAVDPEGLQKMIGTAATSAPSGMAGSLNTYLNIWSNGTNGQLKTRTDANTKAQASTTDLSTKRDEMWNSAYARYLKQYTDLQNLQATMNHNLTLFDSLFGSDKS